MQTNLFSRFFTLIFGKITWTCPSWLNSLCQKIWAHSRIFWAVLIGLIAAVGLLIVYQSLPQPNRIVAHITAPDITPLADELIPHALTIEFAYEKPGSPIASIAPLNLIGKQVAKGISISPAIPGTWVWENDNRLVFTPNIDWPAGEKYTIHTNKEIFAKGTPLKSLDYSFITQAFTANITEFKFYQDPINPNTREAIATISFNYPVDIKSLENNVELMLQAISHGEKSKMAERFTFTITYDKYKRTAYLHSESLKLPVIPRYLEMTLNKGIKVHVGDAKTTESISKTVLIPDAQSYFKIDQATANIIRNGRDQPEQILNIETTVGVTEAILNKNLHAYLLPQDYPATATEESKPNYAWQNPGEVSADILALATPLSLTSIPADRDYASLHNYQFNVENPGYIYLKIDKGTRAFGDFELANDYMAVIKVPEYPKEIGFLHKGALLSLSGEKKLSVTVRGLPAVKFSIARVLPHDINQLVTQTEGSFNNPQFLFYHFNKENISEIFSETREFDANNLAKLQYSALDLGKYLANKSNPGGPLGLFLLQAKGWDPKTKEYIQAKASRLILITDLGLLVKDNHDGSHDIFVQSISTGKPVANAGIFVLGKNGLAIATRITDASGHAYFSNLDSFIEEREPTVYLARLNNDVSFIPYKNTDRELNFSRFDVGGIVSNNEEQSTLSAYIFSDRGIYRPGDKVNLGVIVKKAYAAAQAAGLPVQLTISNPRGNIVLNQSLTLDASGYFASSFDTSNTSPTGQYSVFLNIVKDKHASSLLGSTTFKVAEFLPDRMHITAKLSHEATKGWISPQDLSAIVNLTNLYGTPAADRKISGRILLSPQAVKFSQYSDYIFTDPLLDPKKAPKVFTEILTDVKTNEQGIANLALHLDRFDKATYQLTIFAEGFEAEGGRSVNTQTTALVSPLDYLVGYKTDGDLRYIKQNSQRQIKFIAINPQLKQQALTPLSLQLFKQSPVTTLVKNDNGTYQYQSLIQSSELSKSAFTIAENGTYYTLPSHTIGDFIVKIIDKNGTELSHVNYTIVGESQQPLSKNAELNIKLNKAEYLPDQDIEMQITTPYVGSGFITIERDKIYAYQWFQTNTTTSLQKIHIPKDFQGGGYVNVAFVRDWNSPEIFMSPLSYHTVPFTVNKASHTLTINLNVPEVTRPDAYLPISYSSDKPGKAIIFIVDEGILQVTHYQTPNPLEFFFQKRALEVNTQQILDQILPKYMADRELSAVGGDNGESDLGKYINPFKRKTDLPVVYWSGIVDTDQTPKALRYKVPDYFNGSLRVMAVAVSNDAVGSSEKSTKVRGDFIINPNIPTFVAPGDTFEITASIANNLQHSGTSAPVNVTISTGPQFELLGPSQQTVKINEGKEQTIRLKLKAKPILGSAAITITAGIGNQSNKITTTLSIRPASTYLTTVNSGYTNKKDNILKLDRQLYPEKRSTDAAISESPLILVYGLERYLNNYPYGCTEQLVSKAFPLLAMSDQTWFTTDNKLLNSKIQSTIQMLTQRQLSSGGISYWPDMSNNINNPFASVYAMHFLTEARTQGYDVPKEMFSNGMAYLKDLATQSVSNLNEARIKAYAIYILTRNEIITTNDLINLQLYLEKDFPKIWHQDIMSVYMASTYLLLKNYPDGERLMKAYQPGKSSSETDSDFYDQNIAKAEYLYLIARHFPDYLPRVGNDLVQSLITTMNSDEMNTILSSYTSLALSSYAKNMNQKNNTIFRISSMLANNKQITFPGTNDTYQKISSSDNIKSIQFMNPSSHYYFYQIAQTGFDINTSHTAIKKHLEVLREYRDAAQNVITSAELGQEIEVHIRIRALDNSYLNNIAIIDLLPGGFDVVNDFTTFKNVDYADVREDRVIFFTNASVDVKEIVYKIKATNSGDYTVPAITASSMYNPTIVARGEASNLKVR